MGFSHPTGVGQPPLNLSLARFARVEQELAVNLFQRYRAVEDSTTYQYIIDQGEIKNMRRVLLKRGASRLGAPTEEVKAAIQELEDLPRLERMMDCALDTATAWNDVLGTP